MSYETACTLPSVWHCQPQKGSFESIKNAQMMTVGILGLLKLFLFLGLEHNLQEVPTSLTRLFSCFHFTVSVVVVVGVCLFACLTLGIHYLDYA